MKKLIEFFRGMKTKLVALVIAIYGVLNVFNVINITPEQEKALGILGVALLAVFLHEAIVRK